MYVRRDKAQVPGKNCFPPLTSPLLTARVPTLSEVIKTPTPLWKISGRLQRFKHLSGYSIATSRTSLIILAELIQFTTDWRKPPNVTSHISRHQSNLYSLQGQELLFIRLWRNSFALDVSPKKSTKISRPMRF